MKRPLASLRQVTVTYQYPDGSKHVAIDGQNLDIFQGQHLLLLGSNGAGKSTLLSVLRGEHYPDQDKPCQVLWYPLPQPGTKEENADLPIGESSPLAGRAMSALVSPSLQDHYIRSAWRIQGEELVIAGLFNDYVLYGEVQPAHRAQCLELAQSMGAEKLLHMPLSSFSQGQLRLLLLARALICKPALLLLDEATEGLDKASRNTFLQVLEKFLFDQNFLGQNTGSTVVFSTHRPGSAPAFIKQALMMEKGRLREWTGASAVPNPLPFLSASQSPQPETKPQESKIVPKKRSSATPASDLRIILCNATVYVERQPILRQIDWDIRSGENWWVHGVNGAGKSTLLRLLVGEEQVALGGNISRILPGCGPESVQELSLIQKSMRLVSDALQTSYSYDDTVFNVVFSGFDGSIGVYRDSQPHEEAEVKRCLDLVGMASFSQRSWRSLSTGQLRRVFLARALTGSPALLLLDEPFSGLDPNSRAELKHILENRMAAGLQVVLVSHHNRDTLIGINRHAKLEQGCIFIEDNPSLEPCT